ncbi:MAG: cobalt-precorrin-5B (C(1))-methyltransferase CbiD [Phormidium sp.]
MQNSGYTLPVFAIAAAKAALLHLQQRQSPQTVQLNLLPDDAEIPIEQVACLDQNRALAITRSDPGANLDLTRNTPIWADVSLDPFSGESLSLVGGEGIGRTQEGQAAIYNYARRLAQANLFELIPSGKTLRVVIILPEGRQLAKRTSNEAFGVLEGLSLLGTHGIAQPHTAIESLETAKTQLQDKSSSEKDLVFCIGSNGLQVAERLNLPKARIVQVGNWLGALLVEAGLHEVRSVLLLGYHGKLVKLAGNIFNTSSHIADGKLEILAAFLARYTDNVKLIREVLDCRTMAEAHQLLDQENLAETVFKDLCDRISQNAQAYVHKYANTHLEIGVILFERQGVIVAQNAIASDLIEQN